MLSSDAWTRRRFMTALAAACATPALAADAAFRPVEINHVALRVADLKASEEFYRTRFGAPGIIFERPGQRYMRMGPNFVALFERGDAAMDHFAISIEAYDPDAVEEKLRQMGLKARRTSSFVYVHDPDGMEVQVAHAEHEVHSPVVREKPSESVFQGNGINHVALRVDDLDRSREFYQRLFGFPVVRSGPASCFLGVNRNFLALFRGDSAGMDHFCISIDGFDANAVVAKLKELGETPRREQERVYFPDPSGLSVQVASADHEP
jgi:catechol 2,3-dioxygenase-like lactoylglutathione lyase family enzyme